MCMLGTMKKNPKLCFLPKLDNYGGMIYDRW